MRETERHCKKKAREEGEETTKQKEEQTEDILD